MDGQDNNGSRDEQLNKVEVDIHGLNTLLRAKGITLRELKHPDAKDFGNFTKDVTLKLKFRLDVKGELPRIKNKKAYYDLRNLALKVAEK